MAGITQTLKAMPPKLELPWGTPPKPNMWSCKLISAPKDAPLGGGVLYYEIKSPVLNVKNGYRSLMMKFAWTGVQPVIIDVYCTDNGVNLVSLLKIPQYITLEEALVRVWEKITWHYTNQEVFFNTKVASKKNKKRKPNPKSIDRYVKEYAEQKGYDSAEDIPSSEKGKAYAIAWSRYCSKRPGSPRCKKDKGTYFPKRPNIAKGIAKSMEEKRRKRTKKKASTLNVVDRHIKVASESPSTLRDLFYGDYKSINLSWGNPAKPNLWKTELTRKEKRVSGAVVEYTVKSPVLKDQFILKFKLKISWNNAGIRNEYVEIYIFYLNTFTYAPLVTTETVSSAEFDAMMKSVWEGFMIGEGKKPQYLKILKPGVRVASESPSTLRDLFLRDYRSIKLKWGKPAKPSLWKTELVYKENNRSDGHHRLYLINSPFLLNPIEISFTLFEKEDAAGQVNEYVRVAVNLPHVKSDTFDSFVSFFPVPEADFDKMMVSTWDRILWEARSSLHTKVLKPGVRVASESPSTLGELMELKPDTFELAWGNPPKPNMWKVTCEGRSKDRVDYKVTSPILTTALGIILYKTKYNIGLYVGYRDELMTRQEIKSIKLYKETYNTSLDIAMKHLWDVVNREIIKSFGFLFKPNTKVASQPLYTLRDFFNQKPETFELAWGTPAKKNMWKVMKENETRNETYYRVKSPALNLDLSIQISIYRAVSEVEVRLITKDNQIGKTLFFNRFDDKHPNLDLPFDTFMEEVWRGVAYEASQHPLTGGTPILKPGFKVASREPHATTREVFMRRPRTIELAWGNPPKKNLWKADLKSGGSTDFYHIHSPVLKPNTSLELRIKSNPKKYYVNINILNPNGIGKYKNKVMGLTYWNLEKDDPILEQPFESFTSFLWNDLVSKGLTKHILNPNVKVASASGRYGYTKKVQKDCELAVSQLKKKYCRALCSKQKSKGDKHLEFYRAHAEKSGSPFVKAFVQCHKDIYNEALSKIASSMYGYDERTVRRCLSNINDLQIRSAMLINKLLARKTSDSDKIKAYLSEHIEQTECVWSTCLYSCL